MLCRLTNPAWVTIAAILPEIISPRKMIFVTKASICRIDRFFERAIISRAVNNMRTAKKRFECLEIPKENPAKAPAKCS